MQKKSITRFTVSFCVFFLICCSNDPGRVERVDVVNDQSLNSSPIQLSEDAVSVYDFTSSQPFFSSMKTSSTDMEWKTIQVNERKKEFVFGGSRLISIEDKIAKAEIIDDLILVNHGVHTGVSLQILESMFIDLNENEDDGVLISRTPSSILVACCEAHENEWEFLLENDTLKRIIYTNINSLE